MAKNKTKKVLCPCGKHDIGSTCNTCSRYRIWIGPKTGTYLLENTTANPVHYNFVRQNKMDFDKLKHKLVDFVLAKYESKINMINKVMIFENRGSKQLLHTHIVNPHNYNK